MLNAQWKKKKIYGSFLHYTPGQRGNYATSGLQLIARSAQTPVQQQLWEKPYRRKKSDSIGSPVTAGTAWTAYCYHWSTAAPAFPASPKASEIAQLWESQGKFCYALLRNVPPTTVVSSHKRIISETISEVHGIVYRFYWNIAPGRGSQTSQTILRLLQLEEILGQNFKKADALNWETLGFVEKAHSCL